jgi:hypothetical protein
LSSLLGGWLTVTNLKPLVVDLHITADAAPGALLEPHQSRHPGCTSDGQRLIARRKSCIRKSEDPSAFELSRWRDGRCGVGLRVVFLPV